MIDRSRHLLKSADLHPLLNLQQFADEVISVEERYDPYDRSIQLVPVVKQERGALRWLGDVIFNAADNLREDNGSSARPNFGQKLFDLRPRKGGRNGEKSAKFCPFG